nr:malonyl CoA-acyl carrier protein transacylase [uncultured bacterium]
MSSFGIGGTNAHVVVEEAPEREESSGGREWQLLVLSAKTGGSLERATEKLAEHLREEQQGTGGAKLADIAYTLQVGRQAMKHRRAVLCREVGEAVSLLESSVESAEAKEQGERSRGEAARGRVWHGVVGGEHPSVVFMFSGQGTQYVQMGRGFYERETQYRAVVDECAERLEAHLGLDLRRVLYPGRDEAASAQEQIDETWLTQPALFVVEYALARQWMKWGVRPAAMIGHSIGEYVAACVSGVLELEDALRMVAVRGRLMQGTGRGAMLAVGLGEEEVERRLAEQEKAAGGAGAGLWVAAVNGRQSSVVSGSEAAVEQFENRLRAEAVGSRRLHSRHAFHSGLMERAVTPLVEEMRKVRLREPEVRYISNVTGGWIRAEEAKSTEYWGRQMRERVRFGEGIEEILRSEGRVVLLEVGPGTVLTRLAEQQIRRQEVEARESDGEGVRAVAVQSLRGREEKECEDEEQMVRALGQMYVSGVEVEWERYCEGEHRVRVGLPTYQFERERYWVEASKGAIERRAGEGVEQKESGKKAAGELKRADLAQWFYVPYWKPAMLDRQKVGLLGSEAKRNWLVFVDESGVGESLVERLKGLEQKVVSVSIGDRLAQVVEGVFTIDPLQREDYAALLKELARQDCAPQKIVHMWSLTGEEEEKRSEAVSSGLQARGFYSLLRLAQAIGQSMTEALEILVISNDMQSVTGVEALQPLKATVLGPCKVIPQEFVNIRCRSIDLSSDETVGWQAERLMGQLVGEISVEASEEVDSIVALRRGQRWVERFEAVRLTENGDGKALLREGGVYLITGGLGGIGLAVAEQLARVAQAKLVLLGRAGLPDRAQWDEYPASTETQNIIAEKIKKVRALEALGAEVLVFSADVSDESRMREVVAEADARFGAIHGVIHAAGVPGGGYHSTEDAGGRRRGARPEGAGDARAGKVLQDRPLDFLVLFFYDQLNYR